MAPLHVQPTNSTLRGVIMRLHFPPDIALVYVRWYAAYPLSRGRGQTVDFLLTTRRDVAAARRFLERAIGQHDVPGKIIDKSSANTTAVRGL